MSDVILRMIYADRIMRIEKKKLMKRQTSQILSVD